MTTVQMPISRDSSLPDAEGLVIACGHYAQRMAQRVVEVRNEFRHQAVVQSTYWTEMAWEADDAELVVEVRPAGDVPAFTATDLGLAAEAIEFAAVFAQRRQVRSDK